MNPTPTSKVCNTCSQELPIDQFHRDDECSDGYKWKCKSCAKKAASLKPVVKHPRSTVGQKACKTCHTIKPITDFQTDYRNQDGTKNSCSICFNAKCRAYSRAHPEVSHARFKERMKDPEFRAKENAYQRGRYQKEKIKRTARNRVTAAVRGGKLKPMPCEKCGSVDSQAHHDDYSKPLQVRWLCPTHHGELHRKYP